MLGLLLAYTISPANANETSAPATPAAVSLDSEQRIMTVATIDKQWDLRLIPKQLVGDIDTVESAILGLPQFFDGSVVGDSDSWVRMTVDESGIESIYSGHVFTQGELYELQYREDMGGHALAPQPGNLTLSDMVLPESGSQDKRSSTAKLDDSDVSGSSAKRAIKIGITVDSSYNEHYDQRGLAHALSIINGVDGLYQEQLGLAVIVDGYRLYDDPEQDPLRDYPGNVDQILSSYRDIRVQDEELPAELALVHLFSGHPDPDKIIGLGWIDTLCRLDGYDLSMSTPFPYDMLLSAHEIAHNLGAEHDDDAACSTDGSISGGEIMWSELSGNTRPAFSTCSLESMRPALSAECVLDNIDVGVALSAQTTSEPAQLEFSVSAFNNDGSRVAPQITSTTTFPTGTRLSNPSAGCSISDTELSCRHSVLQPGSDNALSVTAEFVSDGATYPLVVSELKHGGFTDTELLDNRATLQLDDPQLGLNSVTFAIASDDPNSLPASDGNSIADILIADQQDNPESGGSAGAGSTNPLSLALMALFGLLASMRRRVRA